ncbi:Acyl-CoA synthetase short-chain member 3, mitochondrial, partial [Cladochytrium tenue]
MAHASATASPADIASHPQQALHHQSLHDREAFWMRAARLVHWHRYPSRAYGRPQHVADQDFLDRDGNTWFPDGQLSTCFNAIDRHVFPPPTPLSVPAATPRDLAAAADPTRAGRVAFHHVSPLPFQRLQYRAVTYGEALEYVRTLAGVLRAKGVGRGDVVIIYMPMIPETALAMLACTRIGAVHSVVFGGFASKELAKRIQDSRCKLVLSASCGIEPKGPLDYKPLVDGALRISPHKPAAGLLWLRRLTVNGHEPARVAASAAASPHGLVESDWLDEMELTRRCEGGREPVWECVPVDSQDPVYTLYTSGTTGMPKGVMRSTGGNAVGLRYSIEHYFGVTKDDTMFTASDLGWVVGHSYICLAPLLVGAATIIFEGKPVVPDAGIFWRVVADLRATHMFTAPTALRAIRGLDPDGALMRAADLTTLRALFLAGERSEPTIVSAFATLLKKYGAPGACVVDNYWST